MARRSPMNNRYQKGTEPKGVTRKSAASAKPKRAIGEQNSSSKTGGKKASGKKGDAKKRSSFLREMPDTPEYKQQRKIWWYCLGAAFLLLILSLSLGAEQVYSLIGLSGDQAAQIGLGMTWAAMFMVGFAWYLDFKKIRPLVRAFEAEKAGGKEGKQDKKSDDKKPEGKKSEGKGLKDKEPKAEDANADKKSKSKDKDAGSDEAEGESEDESDDEDKSKEDKPKNNKKSKSNDKKSKDDKNKSKMITTH
ncbi:MAG: hypothetical protein FWE48_00125 [Coriobacteriia bacterium]|nr:hypothetical protein [Coriobacteriia bacterium]MCL2745494.1 hypothetical protein [Coriobacteriia bacterium]MCL2871193.1 hypothetical protein [Coriobacteriia bacterium]